MKQYPFFFFSRYGFLLGCCLLLATCNHDHEHDHAAEEHGHDHATEAEHAEDEIYLTRAQVETIGLTFGEFSDIKINDFIRATGTLGLPPNALTSVSAKAAGFIVNSNKYVEGNYVKKGVVMAYLENPDFIQQQQEYLEVKAALAFAKQELARQQTLLAAEAGLERNVQQLQAEVAAKTARQQGLAKQLAYLGIGVAQLSPDNIVQRIPIYAPMAGYLTSIRMHNGMYVTPERELMEIVNENHLHLELDVFEQDIGQIAEEQEISYTVPALGNTVYRGEVHVIGKEFNRENKTVRIHGHLGQERPTFIKDLFVEAKIWLNDQSVQALPEGAIIKNGTSSYIYVSQSESTAEELSFEAIMIVPGTSSDGYTAVKLLEELPQGAKIVTEGAYYVYAQSQVGELEHSH